MICQHMSKKIDPAEKTNPTTNKLALWRWCVAIGFEAYEDLVHWCVPLHRRRGPWSCPLVCLGCNTRTTISKLDVGPRVLGRGSTFRYQNEVSDLEYQAGVLQYSINANVV